MKALIIVHIVFWSSGFLAGYAGGKMALDGGRWWILCSAACLAGGGSAVIKAVLERPEILLCV